MFRIDEPWRIRWNAFHLARSRSATRCKCFGSAKICFGADLVSDFRLHRSALTDKSRAFRISPNDHVEVGDGTVQLTFTAECGCSAAKCRKIIRLQLNDAIIADNWLTSISSAIAEYFLQIM